MKKVFVILCIVVVGLLGLNMLPERAATADSEFMIGDLSKLAQQLNVEPGDDGKYTLASILEALWGSLEAKVHNLDTKLSYRVSHSTGSELSGRIDSLQDWAWEHVDWANRELNRLWDAINDLYARTRY